MQQMWKLELEKCWLGSVWIRGIIMGENDQRRLCGEGGRTLKDGQDLIGRLQVENIPEKRERCSIALELPRSLAFLGSKGLDLFWKQEVANIVSHSFLLQSFHIGYFLCQESSLPVTEFFRQPTKNPSRMDQGLVQLSVHNTTRALFHCNYPGSSISCMLVLFSSWVFSWQRDGCCQLPGHMSLFTPRERKTALSLPPSNRSPDYHLINPTWVTCPLRINYFNLKSVMY